MDIWIYIIYGYIYIYADLAIHMDITIRTSKLAGGVGAITRFQTPLSRTLLQSNARETRSGKNQKTKAASEQSI